MKTVDISGLAQNCSISIGKALEIPQSCTKPSILWISFRGASLELGQTNDFSTTGEATMWILGKHIRRTYQETIYNINTAKQHSNIYCIYCKYLDKRFVAYNFAVIHIVLHNTFICWRRDILCCLSFIDLCVFTKMNMGILAWNISDFWNRFVWYEAPQKPNSICRQMST